LESAWHFNPTFHLSEINAQNRAQVRSLKTTLALVTTFWKFPMKFFFRRIGPTEQPFVSFVALGEGWHNYHHTFPWDYKTAELGVGLNWTAHFLRFCQFLGLAYDLKSPSIDLVNKVATKYGDGTRNSYHFEVLEPENDTDDVRISKVGEELMEKN